MLTARHSQTHFCRCTPLVFAGPSFPKFCCFSSHFGWVSIIFRHPFVALGVCPAGPPNSRLGREISENLFEASEAVTDLEGQQPPGCRKSLLFEGLEVGALVLVDMC